MKREFIGMIGKLTCELAEENGVVVVTVSGQADVYTSGELGKIMEAYLARGQTNILLDMENLKYLDSSTLAALLKIQKKARAGGGNVKLLRLGSEPREVFEVSGFLNLFETFEDREVAISSFTN
ncbi:MAG: STAS domain-containing protein [PVC group bacterium]